MFASGFTTITIAEKKSPALNAHFDSILFLLAAFIIPAQIIERVVDQLKKGILPIVAKKEFSEFDQIRYYFLMKLFGGSLEFRYIRRKYRGVAVLRVWKEFLFFVLTGALKVKERELFLTDKGYFLWMCLMREFFTGINIFREQCLPENRPFIFSIVKRYFFGRHLFQSPPYLSLDRRRVAFLQPHLDEPLVK